MKLRALIKTCFVLSIIANVYMTANAEMPKPDISGFIDTTYNYNFNKPFSRRTVSRSFDRVTDAFLLNAIQVNIAGNAEEGIGYYGELAFGTDPSIYKSAGSGTDGGAAGAFAAPSAVAYNVEVQEAFLTYKCPITAIQLKAGKFVTFQGIEVIESKDNFTISRGHIFGLAEPYTHVGAVVGYALPKIADLWVGVVNGWDINTDNNYGKTIVAKLGLNFGEKFFGSISMTRGQEQFTVTNTNQRTSVDSTWFVKPLDKLVIGLQGNVGQEEGTNVNDNNADGVADGGTGHWYGIGIQPKYDFTDKLSLGARYEWFSDLNGARTNFYGVATYSGTVSNSFTLCPAYKLSENLLARVEYRYDMTSRPGTFENNDGVLSHNTVKSASAEFVYKF